MQEQTDGPVRRQNRGRLGWHPLRTHTESGRGHQAGPLGSDGGVGE